MGQIINCGNMRMIQRRQYARFTFKSSSSLDVLHKGFRKKLERNTSSELQVRSLIDLAHAARTEMGRDLVMRESGSDHDLMAGILREVWLCSMERFSHWEGGFAHKSEDRQFFALVKAGWTRHQEKCREAP